MGVDRQTCPKCGKKGVFQPDRSRWPSSAEFAWDYRECQYCRSYWNSGASWASACKSNGPVLDRATDSAMGAGGVQHGVNCQKVAHSNRYAGYLHAEADDGPYDVDGISYCGRCHYALPNSEEKPCES